MLFFLADPAAAVRACAGLLAPRGRLGITMFGPTDERWRRLDEVFARYVRIRFTWSTGQRASWEAVPVEQHDALRDEIRSGLATSAT